MPKLTKRIVDQAPQREAPYFLWCSDLPGFGVRVFPSRKAIYYADYRTKFGTRKRMSIGHHGKLTTEEARREAVSILGDVVRGGDPAGERATRRASLTMKDLCATYLAAAEQGLILGKGGRAKKTSTLDTDKGRVARHIVPLLGRKLVTDIAPADINRFIRDVASGKTAVVERTAKPRGKAVVDGGAGTATRTAGLLGGILSFAVSEGIIPHNPARGVKRPADGRRTRRLTTDEYRALGDALTEAEKAGEPWQGVVGIRLLALTGCRLGEVAGLRWSEVDMEGQALRLEDSKEGASVRPLGAAAVALLASARRVDECLYVLPPARSGDHFRGIGGVLERITARAGLDGVTAHTLRHSFASTAGDLGYADSTIGTMLGHSTRTITGRYVHRLDSTLIAAAGKVAEAIAAALGPAPAGSR